MPTRTRRLCRLDGADLAVAIITPLTFIHMQPSLILIDMESQLFGSEPAAIQQVPVSLTVHDLMRWPRRDVIRCSKRISLAEWAGLCRVR